MKITLDLTSVVVGGAVALVLGVVAGFSPQATSIPAARPATPVTTMGANRPAARDIVWLEAQSDFIDTTAWQSTIPGTGFSSPLYTVPSGKILVLTNLSGTDYAAAHEIAPGYFVGGFTIEIDGVAKRYSPGSGTSGVTFGTGIPLQAGQTVQLLQPTGTTFSANLHGYLEDA